MGARAAIDASDAARRAASGHRVRRSWMDNLRVTVIVAVIVAHVATAYIIDPAGWYYEERTASEAAEALVLAVVGPGLLFGMGVLFLLAGLLSAPALARKGPGRFAIDRLLRLGLPLFVYVWVVDSLTGYLGDRGSGVDVGFFEYLGRWWPEYADFGVAWFIAALLGFSLVYAGWRALRPPPRQSAGRLHVRHLVALGAFIAAGTYFVRLWWGFGAEDSFFGLNLWEFPQMIGLFTLGVLAAERGWLDTGVEDRLWHRCGGAALGGGVAFLLVGAFGDLTSSEDPFSGGLHVEAIPLPVVEAVIAVSASVWTLEWFRRRWNGSSPLSRALGRSSYLAYLVHPPVVVALMVAVRSVTVPAEAKFLVVSVLGVVGSFGVAWLARRWPPIARIL
jgi:glucan biosynthesis protein C